MARNVGGTIVKLAILSLLVGLVLSLLDISPKRALEGLGGFAKDIVELVASFFAWAAEYILVGAAVVVPIWLILWALRSRRS